MKRYLVITDEGIEKKEGENEMEQVLRSLTLNFFGKGKHKISPDKFFEIENGFFWMFDQKKRQVLFLLNSFTFG